MGFLNFFSNKDSSNFYRKKYQSLRDKNFALRDGNRSLKEDNQKLRDYCIRWEQHCRELNRELEKKRAELKKSEASVNKLRDEIRLVWQRLEQIENNNVERQKAATAREKLESMGYSVSFSNNNYSETDLSDRVKTVSSSQVSE